MHGTKTKSLLLHSAIENSRVVYAFCLLILCTVTLVGWQGFRFYNEQTEVAKLHHNRLLSDLEEITLQSASLLSTPAQSLAVISRAIGTKYFDVDTLEGSQSLTEILKTTFASSPLVLQARYINKDGLEMIRLQRNARNEVIQVGVKLLQNKSKHDYFADTKKLKKFEFYISELNLNMEFGKVQEPWQPTVRIATPVYGQDEKFEGILIINLDAGFILTLYDQYKATDTEHISLVNPRGYWLHGVEKDRLWRFMFDSDSSLASESPKLWQRIIQRPTGVFQYDHSIWAHVPVTVNKLLPHWLNVHNNQRPLWIAILQRNPPSTWVLIGNSIIPAMIILVILGVSWAFSLAVIAKARTEKELIRSEKLSSLGGLVAGVAHELNTPIGCAVTITSTMQEHTHQIQQQFESGEIKKSEIIEYVENISHGSHLALTSLHRAADLIGHFKKIAVDQSNESRRLFELDKYIEETLSTLQHLFKNRPIALELKLHSQAYLNSYPGPLSQVVINLVNNALIHGFDKTQTGIITIETKISDRTSNHVELIITDNGKGISKNIQNKIFEPFFTTKLGQGGSGLGLHITHNIVTNILSGHIHFSSNDNETGAHFTVSLPIEKIIDRQKSSGTQALPQKEISVAEA